VNPVFLDSVGLLAYWNKRDQWHTAASGAFVELRRERHALFSTPYVIAECANALSRFPSRARLAELVDSLRSTNGLIFPTDGEWKDAWANYVKGHAGSPGFVDHVSFVVMRRLRLRRVFTNDQHFRDAGFTTLF
jgi:predicted nucleic acid-binding protein